MLYEYECPDCAAVVEFSCTLKDHQPTFPCAECGGRMVQQLGAAYLTPDIAPYKAMAGDRAGQMITSRKDHREFLKRNRFTEVGNEPIRPIKNDFTPRKGEIAHELKRVIPQVLRK